MTPEERADIAWRAVTGREDAWGGCADRAQIERVNLALAEAERRGAVRALRDAAAAITDVTHSVGPGWLEHRADQIAQGQP